MPGLEKLQKKVVACVTCDYWKGEIRRPSENRQYVLFESFQRGICSGRINTGQSMTPLNKCKAWRMWAKMHKAAEGDSGLFVEYDEEAPDDYFEEQEEGPFIAEREPSQSLKPSAYLQELMHKRRAEGEQEPKLAGQGQQYVEEGASEAQAEQEQPAAPAEPAQPQDQQDPQPVGEGQQP